MMLPFSLEEILFFSLCGFFSIVALSSRVYGYKILFSLTAGMFWILFGTQMSYHLFKVLFALFGSVFLFFGFIYSYKFNRVIR